MSNFSLPLFSNNLKKVRIKLGLNLDEISNILDVGKSAYYKYENGSRFPKPEILFSIMSNFDININYLLTGEGDMFIRGNKKYGIQSIAQPLSNFNECDDQAGDQEYIPEEYKEMIDILESVPDMKEIIMSEFRKAKVYLKKEINKSKK